MFCFEDSSVIGGYSQIQPLVRAFGVHAKPTYTIRCGLTPDTPSAILSCPAFEDQVEVLRRAVKRSLSYDA
ncbi:hypothetical protein [Rhizobium sp. Root1220]|uniref:hypothetical protein n=1 Tax=Rhizobium sp. Root1220 TaxID=1736432 RepID=UPI0006FB8C06|nr:hypothetical protein [Rhizobium sp. Root1220]KQV70226.1 hypothetical protein ASC90_08860 [Rhizobium sp. Root1220]